MPLDISKIQGEVERRLRARGLPTLPWSEDKWVEEASVDLRSRYLRGAKLRGANLTGADLHDVDLSDADLTYADLSRANLSGANLSRADLSNVNIAGANLTGTNFERAKFPKIKGLSETNWASVGNIDGTTLGIATYLAAYQLYANTVDHFRPKGYQGTEKALRDVVTNAWSYLIGEGRTTVDYILDKLVVPPNKTKSFEVAARLVRTSSSSPPRNVFTWWDENVDRFALIANGYLHWPKKTEGSNELFRLGSFTVHNTINLKGPKLDKIKEILGSAETTISKNCIPELDKTLYGDIYIVAQIQQAATVAWYNPQTDKVYLRSAKNDKWAELESILHELGHRYWKKVATSQQKDTWDNWYRKQKALGAEIPQVGDVYETFNAARETQGLGLSRMEIQRVDYAFSPKGRPVVTVFFSLSTETQSIPGALGWGGSEQDTWAKIQNFPSPYAAQNAEECFCEMLSFLAMGLLPPKYATPFLSIWG